MKTKLKPYDKLNDNEFSKNTIVKTYSFFLAQSFVKSGLVEGEQLIYEKNGEFIYYHDIFYKNHTK